MVQAVISFKNGGVAFILAFFLGLFFFNGVGHMYIGKVRRGVGIMILGWIIYSILFIFLVSSFVPVFIQTYNSNNNDFSQSFFSISLFGAIYFIYLIIQAADANRLAKKFNRHLDKTGELLWY